MGVTRCTCLRDEALGLIAEDPLCEAPSHLWDEIEESFNDKEEEDR